MKHWPGLDRLRAIAIVSVLLFHARTFPHPAWVDEVGNFGWTGVDLFFALSGFLIASQLFARLDLRAFYVKRAFRILPAYFVVLSLYALVPALRERRTFGPLWQFVTFTHNLDLDLRLSGTFSHAWSLCVEEQFYLLLPLTLLVLRRRAAWLLPLLFASGLVTRALAWSRVGDDTLAWYHWVYYPTWQRLDPLLAGVAVAALVQHARRWMLAPGLALLTAAWWIFEPDPTALQTIAGFPLVALGMGLVVASQVATTREVGFVTGWLARLSYAIYLVHKAVIHVVQGAFADPASNAALAASLLATLAAALLLHFAVERPFLRLRDRVLLHKPRAALAPEATL